jgi:predicted  nucleic acid-binding Zn-ribbon protein
VSATLTPLPGDPVSLKRVATRYESVAQAILRAAGRLDALSQDDSVGKAVGGLRKDAHGTSGDIRKAQPRYHETASALVEFAVRLTDAQSKANNAIASAESQQGQLSTLNRVKQSREEDRLTAMMNQSGQDELDTINREIRQLESQIGQVEHDVSRAVASYSTAVEERERAIQAAIARVTPVLHELDDRARDYVRAAAEAVEDFVATVAEWVDKILLPILKTIVSIVEALVQVIVVLAFVLLLIAILAAFVVSPLVLFGLAALAFIAVLVAAYVAYVIVKEATSPTPQIIEFPLPKYEDGSNDSNVNSGARSNYENALAEDAYLDSMGGSDNTYIEVVKVVGDDGVTRWRVILPSTQDWEWMNGALDGHWDPKGDRHGVNDLGSNIALMAAPEVQAAYERAVRQAMVDAGVQPGDPVMLVGWSQGGILAGKLAADTSDQFNVQAIFVAGAPIDHMNIPPSVSVMSIQHNGDIVPQLDLTAGRNSANWVTIAEDPPTDKPPHNAGSYGETASKYVEGDSVSPEVAVVRDKQSIFFSKREAVPLLCQFKEKG